MTQLDPTPDPTHEPARDLATARALLEGWRANGTVSAEVLGWFGWALTEIEAGRGVLGDLEGMAFDAAHAVTELAVLMQGVRTDRLRVEEVERR
jgi:hypothetical protein